MIKAHCFSKEWINGFKQLFDIGCLFDEAEKVEEIALSFERIGAKEINYRELEIGLTDVLDDIFATSLLIAKRTKNIVEPDKTKFTELTTGIRRFESFLIAENFKINKRGQVLGQVVLNQTNSIRINLQRDFWNTGKYKNPKISNNLGVFI